MLALHIGDMEAPLDFENFAVATLKRQGSRLRNSFVLS